MNTVYYASISGEYDLAFIVGSIGTNHLTSDCFEEVNRLVKPGTVKPFYNLSITLEASKMIINTGHFEK